MDFITSIFNTPPIPPSTQNMTLIDNQTLINQLVNGARATASQTFLLSVLNSRGDVNILNNSVDQTATVNLTAAFQEAVDDGAMADLALAVQQSAKSLAASIKLPPSNATVTNTSMYIDVSSNISNVINNTCIAGSNQLIDINVKNTGGGVTIADNVFNQVATVTASCFADTIANLNLNPLDAQVAQTLPQPLSYNMLVIYTVAALVVIVSLFYGPLAIVFLGVTITYCGWLFSKTDIIVTEYSELIANTCPDAVLSSQRPVASAFAAGQACLADKTCVAYDVISYTIDDNDNPLFRPLVAKFYSHVPSTCSVGVDSVKLIYPPSLGSGPRAPTLADVDDIWLNTLTSEWYINGIKKGQFSTPPTSAAWAPGVADVVVAPMGPGSFSVTRRGETTLVDGPGYFKRLPNPPNTSGFKKTHLQWVYLIGGCVVILIGLVKFVTGK